MVLKHHFKSKAARFTNSESLTIASGLQGRKSRSYIWVESAITTSNEHWVVISGHEGSLWLLQIETSDGKLALIETLADALGDGFDCGVNNKVSEFSVVKSWAVLCLTR